MAISNSNLIAQTTYAELLAQCASGAFSDAFPEDGAFISKVLKGRRYWYFQLPADRGRTQRYVGPDSPDLLAQIAHHREARDDQRTRRALVSSLVRTFGLPRPVGEIGDIVAALAKAGVFRLRGVLVGTVAYQTYSGMLGCRLPAAALQTGDVDIAQFKNISIAVGDKTPPVLDVLKAANESFRPIPHNSDSRRSTSYAAKGGLRVDFLTPNEGRETDAPQRLPSFQTDAQPLRFLDYLIYEPEPAVLLHDAGVFVHVPAPERYALHKLIVSQRRPVGISKRDKDILQAGALLRVLAQDRPYELKSAWEDAYARGPTWRQLVIAGLTLVDPRSRDALLKIIGWRRELVGKPELVFTSQRPRYDFDRDVVIFMAGDRGGPVRCEISREALEDHFDADGLNREERVERAIQKISMIERMARAKYLSWPIEEPGVVLIRTEDVSRLRRALQTRTRKSGN